MTTIVVDASALVEFLFRTELGYSIEATITDSSSDLHVPSLCDVEVTSALRRGLLRGFLTERRAREALSDYLDLPLIRHGHQGILPRVLQVYETISTYDATYVALAEGLEAPLLTADKRLARGARALGVPCL